MKFLLKILDILKPFKELITIVIFLGGAAYAAFTYFATAEQLRIARAALEQKLDNQQLAAQASLEELKCLNAHSRDLLRSQIEEVGLRSVLERNLQKSEALRGDDSEFARIELAMLEVNRGTLVNKLTQVETEKKSILLELQNGSCSTVN